MIAFDPASFKDPAGRVFHHDGWVGRTLSPEARTNFQSARQTGLIDTLMADDLLLDTEMVPAAALGLSELHVGDFVLRQQRVPMVTYSCEWSFEMLRDAALVTLRILDRALAAGFILKDANSFNILFDGTTPKLVDAHSIEPHRPGEMWAGYAQFCRSFLFPLLSAAYRGIDMQALLRGSFGEVPVQQAARLLGPRDLVRPGVFRDVVLQARLERGFARSGTAIKSTTSDYRYPTAAIVANIKRLHKVIEGLKAPSSPTEWSAYGTLHNYTDADRSAKHAFVERVLSERRLSRVADLGCNTGEYSRVALRAAAHVVSIDLDALAIDRLYRSLPPGTPQSLAVASLLNPTPAMGWELKERPSMLDRLEADGFLALALIHHLRVTGGVPLDRIVSQFFAIAPEGIIEWVDKDDEMVRRMLSLRPDVYADYTWAQFESLVRRHGELCSVEVTHGGRRRLCHVRARRV
jgi:SAM-dependent methyltransferase